MQDFYKRLIRDELYKYNIIKIALPSMEEQIEELRAKKESKQVASYGIQPISGGGSCQEDKLININAKIDMLSKNLASSRSLVKRVEKALEVLTNKEVDIVLRLNCNRNTRSGEIKKLEKDYSYSKSQLYRISDDCLEKLAVFMFGNA